MKKLLLILLSIMIVSCSSETSVGPSVNPEFDRSNQIIRTKVIVHETEKSLNDAYNNFYKSVGKRPDIRDKKEGWSGWNETDPYYCEIHVLRLRGLSDPQMITWGHELAHCLYGRYHKDNER